MKTNFKKTNIPLIICVFSILLLSTYISFKFYEQSNIKKDVFRLHIVGNSNSDEDQILKLKISEKVENLIYSKTSNLNNKEEIYNCIQSSIPEVFKVINTELKDNNIDYNSNSKIKLGKIYYDEKENIYTKMDKGTYDSIQILLGNAEGRNYWNLIFPRKENMDNLKNLENILPNISNIYDKNNIEQNENKKEYTFKLLEIINNFFI